MGVQTIEFLVSKGLRQEDPLALFLFNIVAEGNKRNNWVVMVIKERNNDDEFSSVEVLLF